MSRIRGYPIVFNSRSVDLGFYEFIRSSAVDRALVDKSNIVALANHDAGRPLGRSVTGTLEMEKDTFGLRVNILVDDEIGYAADVVRAIQRGDCDGGSFAFAVRSDIWSLDSNGMPQREVLDMDISELTVGCTFPAYARTRLHVTRD